MKCRYFQHHWDYLQKDTDTRLLRFAVILYVLFLL